MKNKIAANIATLSTGSIALAWLGPSTIEAVDVHSCLA
jgi:hypothetical protein